MKIVEKNERIKFFSFLISIFLLSQFRLIDHPWNFTPVIAFGILSGYYLKNILYGYSLIIISMILGDLIIGFHGLAVFTWGSVLFIGMFSRYFLSNIYTRVGGALLGACIFFLITNFGVWTLGSYEYSLSGFLLCYTLAIPFFGYTLLSTIAFSFLIEVLSIFFKEFKILN